MTVAPDARPAWSGGASVRAVWATTGDSPEVIATHTDALLRRLGTTFAITSWETHSGEILPATNEELAQFVRRSVVRDRPTAAAAHGDALPTEGYSFFVYGRGPRVGLRIRVAAGAHVVGRRVPTHTLLIQLDDAIPDGVTVACGDAICRALADTWEPAVFVLSDDRVRQIARRGNWKIAVGYRTWLHSDVGTVERVANGLTVAPLGGGTLISAPDDWPADRVVAAMAETLAANALDEVPH